MSSQLAEKARPISRAEYERMVDLGLFRNERVELWRGWIVQMSPQKSPHASAVERLNYIFVLALRPSRAAAVRVQLPLALSDHSEPEPDLAVVAPGDYKQAHPAAADVRLIIEVADSSLADDRGFKAEEYAAAGIPEYWIINLIDQLVEVHTRPIRQRYGNVVAIGRGQTLRPLSFPDLTVSTDELLG
jgi:Uma2 family endonuclease